MFVSAPTFTECFNHLVHVTYRNYDFECAPRGQKIRERLGIMFEIADPRDRMLYVPVRKFSTSYMVAEALWYFLGDNRTDWISNYAKFWEDISDDGETANSAYGARIFKPHNYIADNAYTQWDYVKEELTKDRDSRRAVIHVRTPEDSIHAKKDVPCTLALQFFIRKDRVTKEENLYMITHMRSSDLILGISYDVPAFTMFQEALANELGVGLGSYKHISNSLHVYERHFEMCDQIIKDWESNEDSFVSQSMPPMPKVIPVKELNSLQWAARRCESHDDLLGLSNSWMRMGRCELDSESYWLDWGFILMAHRARKLKLPETAEKFIGYLNFEGYKRFKR